MRKARLCDTDLQVSLLGYGCGGLGGAWNDRAVDTETIRRADTLIHTAVDAGINLFDQADIYAFGKSETAMGEVLGSQPRLRERIILQSKCGIRLSYPLNSPPTGNPHILDLSYDHIIASVESSLARLKTDWLDILLLHRPDPLMEPDEVARAVDTLHRTGKVRHFGVSNFPAGPLRRLGKAIDRPLVVNQLRFGLGHPYLVADSLDFNRVGVNRLREDLSGAGDALDDLLVAGMQMQAWAPLRGVTAPTTISGGVPEGPLTDLLQELAETHNTNTSVIALAWILRHPGGILPLVGSGSPENIRALIKIDEIELSRPEWYRLLYAATVDSPIRMF